MIPAPDLVEPVVGFRAWKLIDDRLLSPYIPCRWEGPIMHAACYPANRSLLRGEGWLDVPHASPHPACRCGIHAYHEPSAQAYYGEWMWVEGAVTVWGHLEVHHRGLRAEHARVEALAAPDGRDAARFDAAAAAAARLEVPLVEREALEATAAQAGAPLPRSLLP